ncbi:MAG: hypothetical protein R3C49_22305 [Planctomycetaceae bacterium]
MLKKIVLALVPLTLLATVKADDELTVDIASISDANVEIVENDLNIDVDALAADADKSDDSQETALEACFRRIGYNCGGWGYGSYHNSCYSSCYNNYYGCYSGYCQPLYSYHTVTYCPPVYRTVLTPVYTYYWGCY